MSLHAPPDYLRLAGEAIGPYLVANSDRKTLIVEWARWFEENGIDNIDSARDLVRATVAERISMLSPRSSAG
jgi:hypothetical protein